MLKEEEFARHVAASKDVAFSLRTMGISRPRINLLSKIRDFTPSIFWWRDCPRHLLGKAGLSFPSPEAHLLGSGMLPPDPGTPGQQPPAPPGSPPPPCCHNGPYCVQESLPNPSHMEAGIRTCRVPSTITQGLTRNVPGQRELCSEWQTLLKSQPGLDLNVLTAVTSEKSQLMP